MIVPHLGSMLNLEFGELCSLITNTERSLRLNLRKRPLPEQSVLEPKLRALQDAIKLHEIFSTFQKALEKVDNSWLPKGRIEQVVQACVNGRYKEHDIESIFYEQGGITGVLVLQLGTRNQNVLFAQIHALPVDLREELASQCGREQISPVVQAWINACDKSRTDFNPMEEPPRLDRFAKEKAERSWSGQPPPSKRIRTETKFVIPQQSIPPTSGTIQTAIRETRSSQPKDTLTCLATFPAFLLND